MTPRQGTILRIALGLLILSFLIWRVDIDQILEALTVADPTIIVILCVVGFGDRILMAYKWSLLLSVHGIDLSPVEATRLYLVGHVLGIVTPSAVGTDTYRIVALSPRGKTTAVLSTVVLERAFGLAVLSLMVLASAPWWQRLIVGDSEQGAWIAGVLALFVVGLFALSLRDEIVRTAVRRFPSLARLPYADKMERFYDAYLEHRSWPRTMVGFGLLTVAETILLILANWLAALALHLDVPLTLFLIAMPLVHLLVRLPISFSGFGIQEGLFALVLVTAGYTAADGIAVSLILRAVELVAVIAPGTALLMWSSRHDPSSER